MFRNFFSRTNRTQTVFDPIAPDAPFIAVGDIHGRIDLLNRLPDPGDNSQIICVGDYCDRGDHSADVLRLLHVLPRVICLMGNHEQMLLKFLDDPQQNGSRWLRYGGLQTLASFGIVGLSDTTSGSALDKARDALRSEMGGDLIEWLRNLPTKWQSGNVAVVHGGANPALAIDDQPESTLLWGHPEFGKVRRSDGMWIVHGHTIVDAPSAENGIISIDTGAYATDRLTAARISVEGVSFIST